MKQKYFSKPEKGIYDKSTQQCKTECFPFKFRKDKKSALTSSVQHSTGNPTPTIKQENKYNKIVKKEAKQPIFIAKKTLLTQNSTEYTHTYTHKYINANKRVR